MLPPHQEHCSHTINTAAALIAAHPLSRRKRKNSEQLLQHILACPRTVNVAATPWTLSLHCLSDFVFRYQDPVQGGPP